MTLDIIDQKNINENNRFNKFFEAKLDFTKDELHNLVHFRENNGSLDNLFETLFGNKDLKTGVLKEAFFENGSVLQMTLTKNAPVTIDNEESLGINVAILNKNGHSMFSAPFNVIDSCWPPLFGVLFPLYNPDTNLSEIYLINCEDFEYREDL